jgi:hypothetical protein
VQEQWNDLLATALLGTGQRKSALVAPELEFLNTLKTDTPNQDQEGWLLLASAYAALYRRAGQIPQTATATLALAPPESKPTTSAPVAARLAFALAEARTMEPFVEEILLILAKQGRIVSPALLPDLLTWGQRNKERRALIAPVVGERGLWLTTINPDWKNALQTDAKEAVNPVEAMHRISGQQALYDALSITDNIFSKGFSLLKGQGFSAHGRLIQTAMEKVATLAKPGGTYFSDLDVSKIAVAVPAAALPEFSGQLHKLLNSQQLMPWATDLADRLDFRQQMLEELNRE